MQVTTLLTKHDQALAGGVVTEQQLQQLQQQVSNQGSVLRAAKEASKVDASQQSKLQVTPTVLLGGGVVTSGIYS